MRIYRAGTVEYLRILVSAMSKNCQPKKVIKIIWPFIESKLLLTDSAEYMMLIPVISGS